MIVQSTPNAAFIIVSISKLLKELPVRNDKASTLLWILQIPSFFEENA